MMQQAVRACVREPACPSYWRQWEAEKAGLGKGRHRGRGRGRRLRGKDGDGRWEFGLAWVMGGGWEEQELELRELDLSSELWP